MGTMQLFDDFRYAVRRLWKDRAFTAVVVLGPGDGDRHEYYLVRTKYGTSEDRFQFAEKLLARLKSLPVWSALRLPRICRRAVALDATWS